MTVAVYQPPQRAPKDNLDQIQQALQVATSIYGVAVDKQKLNAIQQQNDVVNKQNADVFDYKKQQDQVNFLKDWAPSKSQYALTVPGHEDMGTVEPRADIMTRYAIDAKAKKDANTPPKPTAGMNKLDQQFAVELNDWQKSGEGEYNKNLQRLEDAKKALEDQKGDTFASSGRLVGNLPDWARSNESIRIRDDVRASAQGALKATLGAQFTEKEGERIQNAAYNEKLPPEENIRKINMAIEELKSNKSTIDSRSNYFLANNGSLSGWTPAEQAKPTSNYHPSAAPGTANAAPGEQSQGAEIKVINGANYKKVNGGWQKITP